MRFVSQIDGAIDIPTRAWLEDCRRCGLELSTYEALKDALVRRVPVVDELAVERLRAFAHQIVESPPLAGSSGT